MHNTDPVNGVSTRFSHGKSHLDVIFEKDVLLHFPYQKFDVGIFTLSCPYLSCAVQIIPIFTDVKNLVVSRFKTRTYINGDENVRGKCFANALFNDWHPAYWYPTHNNLLRNGLQVSHIFSSCNILFMVVYFKLIYFSLIASKTLFVSLGEI